MSAENQNKNWAEIDEDEDNNETVQTQKDEGHVGGRYEFSRVRRPVERTNADGHVERVDQTYLVKKWVFPVRKQVLDRKKMQKFGEVKDVPKGEHRPGDFQVENNINIEKAEEQAEIGVVTQLENLSTAKILQGINRREQERPVLGERVEEKKEDKWEARFKNAAVRTTYSVRVTSIISYEEKLEDIEADLQDYFKHLLEKHGTRFHRLRLLKTRDNPPRFINKCILTFDTNEAAAKALSAIDGATYNDAILEASWAEPSDPNKRRR